MWELRGPQTERDSSAEAKCLKPIASSPHYESGVRSSNLFGHPSSGGMRHLLRHRPFGGHSAVRFRDHGPRTRFSGNKNSAKATVMGRRDIIANTSLVLLGAGFTMMAAAIAPGPYQALFFWTGLGFALAAAAVLIGLFVTAKKNDPPQIVGGTGGRGGDGFIAGAGGKGGDVTPLPGGGFYISGAGGGAGGSAPPRGTHYDATDRQRVRDALREAKDIMTELANANVELHRLIPVVRDGIGTSDAAAAASSLAEMREELVAVRSRILTRFVHGQDDGDEVHAVLDSATSDVLNLVATSITQALKAADAATANPPDLREFFEPHFRALGEAQSKFADWVSQSLRRIDDRRRELGGE